VRTAQKALAEESKAGSGTLDRELDTIGDLTRGAQTEMRTLIFELGRDPVEDGLVAALVEYASRLDDRDGLRIDVEGPRQRIALSRRSETQLFGIGREALANVVKHAGATTAWVTVEALLDRVVVEISDDGCGFDPASKHPGHFGLESMRSRAEEVGGMLIISSRPGQGTVVRVEVPVQPEQASNGA